ncbi:MAG: ABC transporter ATP-binding protein [Desulfurococcaceae archaeon]
MKTIIELRNVHKNYGKIEALKGISLSINEGEIYGIVGPNGSGKTTLLRIICGLIKPTRGEVRVLGLNPYVYFDETRRYIGYLPEEADTYDLLSGFEHLHLYAKLYNLNTEDIKYGVELAALDNRIYDLTRGYSKGMKRRLLLALVLMRKPKVALLDEPTAGLDVHTSLKIRRAIKKYVKETGASVIISSHNMLEIEEVCDRVGLIFKGKIVAEGTVEELLGKYSARNLEEVFETVTGEVS